MMDDISAEDFLKAATWIMGWTALNQALGQYQSLGQ